MEEGRFRLDDFELYKIAREFRRRAYRLMKQLPPAERYALANQMRRAALSVSNNIAEGHGRWHYQENIHFCRISRGSTEELLDDFNTCTDESYCEPSLVAELKAAGYNLIRRINRYIAYLPTSHQGGDQ